MQYSAQKPRKMIDMRFAFYFFYYQTTKFLKQDVLSYK